MTLSGGTRRQIGNTLVGLIVGVVLGLGIAAAIAMFVTKATIPFVNRPARAPVAPEAEGTKLPDPNRALYSKDTPVAPLPSRAPSTSTASIEPTVITATPPNVAPGADGKAPVVERSIPDTRITTLQAGAFSSPEDAESMRGKLALLGFDSRVAQGERDGSTIYRVRLGPYTRIEELNRVRQRLIENGVEATLVAPGR